MSDDPNTTDKFGAPEVTKKYWASPTIENYVRLRRQNIHVPIEIGTTGGIEFVFAMADELLLYGIEPSVVEAAMEADKAAQAELSLVLLELIIDRQKRKKSGETHIVSRNKVISDTLVNYLIAACLEAVDWNPLEISPDLVVLIKQQLGPICSRYELEEKKRKNRSDAMMVAFQIAANGEIPSYRNIAHAMGVEATTVKRWFPEGSFISEMKTFAGQITAVNPPVNLDPKTRSPTRANTDNYKSQKKREIRDRAIVHGLRLRRCGIGPTIQRVAKILKVQPGAVSRFFPKGDFLEQVEAFEKKFVIL